MMDGGIIVLLGPPGAGKGTQAEGLTEKFDLFHLSTGEALREAVREGSQLGLEVVQIMESGELVPDHLVSEIVVKCISREVQSEGFVLDGFPRNLPQAGFLEGARGLRPLVVVNIDLREEVAVRRLSSRRHCVNCGRIYNVFSSPPEKEGVCDVCGGDLAQRKDDREEVIQERLRVYREETEPLVGFYSEQGCLVEVGGSGDPQSVFAQLEGEIGKLTWLTRNSTE